MSGVVWSPIAIASDDLYVLTAEHRLYVARSRDGSYLHVIQPRGFEQLDGDGNVVGGAEDLVCGCKGFVFHGHCYRSAQAIAFEAGEADQAELPRWKGEVAPETELERAAARG